MALAEEQSETQFWDCVILDFDSLQPVAAIVESTVACFPPWARSIVQTLVSRPHTVNRIFVGQVHDVLEPGKPHEAASPAKRNG